MKIAAVLSRFPWPIEKGDKLRAYYQLKGLAEEHEIHLVCLNDSQPGKKDLDQLDFCASITVIPHSKVRVFWNLFLSIFNKRPFQVNYFYSPKMKKALSEVIGKEGIDVCFVQLIRLGMNLPFGQKTGWFLDYMDAFSIGMEKRVRQAGFINRIFAKIEARRLKAYEAMIAKSFNEWSIISERDAAALPEPVRKRTHIIPNGVGEMFFETIPPDMQKDYELIFFGNMGYHPNVQSAKFLLEEIMPRLWEKRPDVRLCIAGARPAPQIRAHAGEKVEVTGFVEDLRSYIRRSQLAIAPLVSGQGLQNKLLESMAMGVPTLTTPLANSALHAEAGKDIVVCEEPEAFVEAILELLEDNEKAGRIGEQGREFVERNFRWEQMNKMLGTVLEKAAGRS